jgi:hypothetical protein
MGKINFSEVEKFLETMFKKMFVKKLIDMTDKEETGKKQVDDKNMRMILKSLEHDLERLSKKSEDMWQHLGMTKEEISRYIHNPGELSKEEWRKIKLLLERIREYKKTLGETLEKEINEDIVASERKKHEDKRINISDKWKPI